MIMPGVHLRLLRIAAGAVFYLKFSVHITAATAKVKSQAKKVLQADFLYFLQSAIDIAVRGFD